MFIYINGFGFECNEGQTILDIAKANNIFIPTLCHKEGLPVSGACGICIVEVEGDSRLRRACPTPANEGMKIKTDTEKVIENRKCILELNLSDHKGDCKAPCQLACPSESDCQGYISLIASGQLLEAVKLMKDAHPFPASVARICPAPCEKSCRRGLKDNGVNIKGLKKFAADACLKDSYTPQILDENGLKIAVIGGGPAGLTSAYFLRRLGYDVSIFEALPKMGGLLRYGIPEYRLPKSILDSEINIIEKMGVKFLNNKYVGIDISLTDLQNEFNTVIVAIGAGGSKKLGCKGEENVINGVDFLKDVSLNKPSIIGKNVVVIGGSNTAIDVARTAKRFGCEVTIAYRRTKNDMPAEKHEIEEAINEGVNFIFLVIPVEITNENGNVTGINLQNKEGLISHIKVTSVISAIGQEIELKKIGVSKEEGLFFIGDVTGETSYAIEAIGQGKKVAAKVNTFLQSGVGNDIKLSWDELPDVLVKDTFVSSDFSDIKEAKRQEEGLNFSDELGFYEKTKTFTPKEAADEAARCLSCGCPDYHECKLIKLSNLYNTTPKKFENEQINKLTNKSNFYFHTDINKCILCGLCVRTCDKIASVLTASNRSCKTLISAAFETPVQNTSECNLCGNCVSVCPTGALYELHPLKKPIVAKEEETISTCMFCGKSCQIKLSTKAGYILRILPHENLLCETGRFGFIHLGERLISPLVRREGLLRRATVEDAIKAVREGINKLTALYGAKSIGVVVSPSYTNEDILAIKNYADCIDTPHIFTLRDTSFAKNNNTAEKENSFCNTNGLISNGISTNFNYYIEKIIDGEIKGLICFDDTLPVSISQIPLDFLAIQTAYVSSITKKAVAKANVILPAPALGEIEGTLTNENGILKVDAAFSPACGYQTHDLIKKFASQTFNHKS